MARKSAATPAALRHSDNRVAVGESLEPRARLGGNSENWGAQPTAGMAVDRRQIRKGAAVHPLRFILRALGVAALFALVFASLPHVANGATAGGPAASAPVLDPGDRDPTCEPCDDWNAAASPPQSVRIEAGIAICWRYCWIFADASPSEAPGARLNDTVIACSCPAWLIAIGPTLRSTEARLDSGTSAPPFPRTKIFANAVSSRRSSSVACRIT